MPQGDTSIFRLNQTMAWLNICSLVPRCQRNGGFGGGGVSVQGLIGPNLWGTGTSGSSGGLLGVWRPGRDVSLFALPTPLFATLKLQPQLCNLLEKGQNGTDSITRHAQLGKEKKQKKTTQLTKGREKKKDLGQITSMMSKMRLVFLICCYVINNDLIWCHKGPSPTKKPTLLFPLQHLVNSQIVMKPLDFPTSCYLSS